jgi:hypothetical protein
MARKYKDLLDDLRREPYWLISGQRLLKIAGASETDSGDSGTGDGGTGGEGEGDSGAGAGDSGGSKDKPVKTAAELEAERKSAEASETERKLREKLRLADQRASNAETKVRDLENKDKSAEERLTSENADLLTKSGRLETVNRQLAIQVAFLKQSHVQWVDPEDALAVAMRSLKDVDVEDDGSVDAKTVKKVVDDLAKAKPHLVKKPAAPSGGGVTGDKGGKGGTADDKELLRQFPAVRSRLRS